MMEAGLLDRELLRKQARTMCEAESVTPIGLENTFTALFLLVAGVVLSFFILLLEKVILHHCGKTHGLQPTLPEKNKNSNVGEDIFGYINVTELFSCLEKRGIDNNGEGEGFVLWSG